MSEFETPSREAAWAQFDATAERASGVRIESLFAQEPDRLTRLGVTAAGVTLDLSKQGWTAEGFAACLGLAEASGVTAARARLFGGEAVNRSEGRPVLHPALRGGPEARFFALGEPVSGAVQEGRAKMKALADGVRSGAVRGATGQAFRNIIHIGIGGSDLGPRLVWDALRPLSLQIGIRFVANVDPTEISTALANLDPATTLVVAVSKTFTTQETLANALVARDWLRASLGEEGAGKHFAAVSAAPDKAVAFGVDPERVFAFWDWVGGRYSIWSAVGLSCAIALGWEAFEELLAGAAAMDDHFATAPLERNAPVLLAMAQIWNRNGMGRGIRAVVPYAQRLRLLPAFLQQLEMESNGKRVRADGRPVLRATAPAVFGDAGTNGQHAFFQLLHQGTDIIPVEFIAVVHGSEGPLDLHKKLLANCLAQGEALMIGRSEADVVQELEARGMSPEAIAELAPQRTFPGDRPSSLLMIDRLTPRTLGALLALYEHKAFVEGLVWEINSFDQWGVELGKTLATRILGELEGGRKLPHDPSTEVLVEKLR